MDTNSVPSTIGNIQEPNYLNVDLSSPLKNPESINWKDETLIEKSPPWWTRFLLEPALLIYMFVFALISNPTTNLYLDRACTLELNYSKEICENLNNHTAALDSSQVIANNYNLYLNLIKTLPSAILSIFIGPWSDKYGRKPPIYMSLIGSILFEIGMILYTLSPNAPMYQTLLYAIPNGLTGGMIGVLGSFYTMATEATRPEFRTIKYAILELGFGIGIPLGTLSAGYIYDQFGYVPVFCVALGCHLFMLVYVYFVIKDRSMKKQASKKKMFLDFFSCDNFKDNIRTALKKRKNYGRAQICTLCISMSIIVLGYLAANDILFLFCKKTYGWDMPYYSKVSTISSAANTVFMVVAVPVMIRWWKVPDHWIGLMGVISMLCQAVVRAFAYAPFMYYTAATVGVFSALAPLAVRSKISKVLEKDEFGKVFSLLATMEFLCPIVGTTLYTQVYNATMNFFPNLTFLAGGVLMLFPLVVYLWLVRLAYTSRMSESGRTSLMTDAEDKKASKEQKGAESYQNS